MTIEQAVERIQLHTAHGWNKSKAVPNDLMAALCEALWDAGEHPQIQIIARRLPNLHERAISPGFNAWRAARGLHHHYPRWANPNIGGPGVLARIVSPEIASAPLTSLDPHNDGRWPAPHPKVVAYLARMSNQSLRDVMALYALIKSSFELHPLYCRLSSYAVPLRKLMEEYGLKNVHDIDPDDLLLRVCEKKAGSSLTETQRSFIVLGWNTLSNAFQEYGERLDEAHRQSLSRFFLKPLQKRYRMHRSRPAILVRDRSHEKVKAKTEIVHRQFHKLRFMAKIRCNQAHRLYEAVRAAIQAVTDGKLPLPYRFHYEETVATESGRPIRQRVLMTIWDSTSLWDHAIEMGHTVGAGKMDRARERQVGRFAPARRRFFAQYRGIEPVGDHSLKAPFWFLDLYDHHVFSEPGTPETCQERNAFFQQHGYDSRRYWEHNPGLVKPLRRHISSDATFLERKHGYRFLHYEGIYATCLFAHLVIRMQTITGARIGEVQQIAQNPECIKQLVNVGPKAATRWVLRMIPKGRKERADYFIDADTKGVLMEVLRLHREVLRLKKLPVLDHQSPKYAADRYLLQWNGRALDQASLNTALRFLLHGAVLDTNGACVHLTTHVLRHGFATEMASLKVPVDVIAQILHQRNLEVTRYYSKPTQQQVMEAAELLFVERIDVAAEARRSPEEIGQMLREAEGQIGALTEVIGGTCVVSNMCPVKFACIGCSGNAPDPERRYQIEKKRTWALQQISWASRERLSAEERQMKRLVSDCDLILEEMTLIERARLDGSQNLVLHEERVSGKAGASGAKSTLA
jgi:integrase